MSYQLQFTARALKDWKKLGETIRQQLKKKLAERLENPKIPGDRLHGVFGNRPCYKIKLRSSGYRLVYEVNDEKITVLVLVVGKRNRSEVYKQAAKIMQE